MPLTAPQLIKHWRDWSACAGSNDWVMLKGRLSPASTRTRDLSLHHKLVWRTAEQLALPQRRALTADDLRHACYLVATTRVPLTRSPAYPPTDNISESASQRVSGQRPVSSLKDLGNQSFSRVLILWRLLIEPDDLQAAMDWDHPENSERQGLLKSLARRAPDATLRAIFANAFGTRLWEQGELDQLRWLSRTIARKQRDHAKPAHSTRLPAQQEHERVSESASQREEPF